MNKKIDISVCVITYNHESFLSRAFESINCQHFKGTVEVIIGVDLSSDATAKLMESLEPLSNFPITVIINQERRGMFNNLRDVLEKAQGKYIAMLEGDDFWYDQMKLQKQFDYMEKHPKCIATAGGILSLKDHKIKSTKSWNNTFDQYYYIHDLIHANRIPLCTVMLRKNQLDFSKIDLLRDSPHLDWPIYLSLFDGNPDYYIKVFSDVFSVYRIHQGGVFSGVDEERRRKNVLRTMQFVLRMANLEYAQKYIQITADYQQNATKKCPGPKELHHNLGMEISSIPSFYLHNYKKPEIIRALMRNPWYVFPLTKIVLRKLIRRYRLPK